VKAAAKEVKDVWARPARIATLALLVAVLVVLYAQYTGTERAAEVARLRAQADAADTKVHELSEQVGLNQRANECRARATAMLDEARQRQSAAEGARDAFGWEALILRAAGQPIENKPGQLIGLNSDARTFAEEAQRVSEMRTRAAVECSTNPDFIPAK
jgi:phosphoribosylanthranilate isomerase